jgi:hypothetical protein
VKSAAHCIQNGGAGQGISRTDKPITHADARVLYALNPGEGCGFSPPGNNGELPRFAITVLSQVSVQGLLCAFAAVANVIQESRRERGVGHRLSGDCRNTRSDVRNQGTHGNVAGCGAHSQIARFPVNSDDAESLYARISGTSVAHKVTQNCTGL